MLIGCVQVSKSDGSQTAASQHDVLLAAGVEPDRIYQDLASGRYDTRPSLTACLKALQPGNTLVLWELDRPAATCVTWSTRPRPCACAASG